MSNAIITMTGGVIRQQKNTILKNVNVEIQNGEFVYLIGKVGSGKSSFLKTLYAELPLEYGSATVAGFQLKKIKKSQIPLLRRKCGIVFQDFKLLIDRNVYANLEFVLRATGWKNKKAIRERIETVLDNVGMTDKQMQMPHQLSGGEQQRIVLARALLNAPPLILADEPTGNIDPETSYRLVELLKEICDTGKTVIIATHQYDLIKKYPGRVLCCENGELVEKTPSTSCDCTDVATEQSAMPVAETEIVATTGSTPEEEDIPNETVPENTPLSEETVPEADTEPTEMIETAEEEEQPEEDILSLIGQLDCPEITAFDYELESLPEIEPEKEKEEEENVKEEVEEKVEETQTEKTAETIETTANTEDTAKPEEQKKNLPPVMDLELID